jgi:hypothetical protein
MRLEKTDRAYSRSKSARVQLHIVLHPEVESLFGICQDFSKTLRANGADEDTISEGRTQLFRLRRLVTGLPLAFNDSEMHINEIHDALKKLGAHPNYGAAKQHLTQATNICEVLLNQPSNPIDKSLRALAEPSALVLTKDAPTSAVLYKWLETELPSFHMKAAAIGDLKNIEEATKLIYICSPTYAAWKLNGPDWRFVRDPRAMESHFIMYPFGETEILIPGLLAGSAPQRKISSHITLQVPYFDSVADTETEWSVEEGRVVDRNISAQDELVSARYVRLAGNYCTFLDSEPDSKNFTVTADSNGKLDVQREAVSELDAGDFIVLRVEGTTEDFIEKEANRLGADEFRNSQRRWQKALKESRERDGSLTRVRERLKNEFNLETTQLADWINKPRRIGPGSESDFVKLCAYLGIQEECQTIWTHLEKIRGFHLQAGARAAKTLRKLLETRDANDPELRNHGFFTITDENGKGAIGVYRILQIGRTCNVDAWRIETVEKVESNPNLQGIVEPRQV